jgi:hypothetical protein
MGFIPYPSLKGGVLRARTRVFTPGTGAVALFDNQVDSLGNESTSATSVDTTALTSVAITAPTVSVTSPAVQLGNVTAVDSVIKGTSFVTDLSASLTLLSTYLAAVGGALATASTTQSTSALGGGATALTLAVVELNRLAASLPAHLSASVFTA